MRLIKQLTFLIFLLLCIFSVSASESIDDINFIYKTIKENHPGTYNTLDPKFKLNLDSQYQQAVIKLKSFNHPTIENQKRIFNEFVSSFNDSHLGIHWNNQDANTNMRNEARQFSSRLWTKDILWITLPTFDLNPDQQKKFHTFNDHIRQLRNTKYIIFDLRGNQGGNSDYGSAIIDSVFTSEYAMQKRCLASKNLFVDWRASVDNLEYINSLYHNYKTDRLGKIKSGLELALAKGDKYYTEHEYIEIGCDKIHFNKEINNKNRINSEIIVIIDSKNVSAALDFIDEAKLNSANVVLVGQQTKADRLYIDIRSVPLPSGLGTFFFPMKVYRNRNRQDNQAYTPDIKYNELENTDRLYDFIVKNIIEAH